MCAVLDEMRSCLKTNNFSYLRGLIEEVQTMGNRMEAGLDENRSKRWKLKNKIVKLKSEVKRLTEQRDAALEDFRNASRAVGAGGVLRDTGRPL